jgi:hypothetical protein
VLVTVIPVSPKLIEMSFAAATVLILLFFFKDLRLLASTMQGVGGVRRTVYSQWTRRTSQATRSYEALNHASRFKVALQLTVWLRSSFKMAALERRPGLSMLHGRCRGIAARNGTIRAGNRV